MQLFAISGEKDDLDINYLAKSAVNGISNMRSVQDSSHSVKGRFREEIETNRLYHFLNK